MGILKTILLADDDQYVLEGLLRHVPWEGMGVRIVGTARNGREALDLYRSLKPDIVITDIYMPEMDGFQLTEAIHRDNPSFPVVILSGYDDYENARRAVRSGIQHFLLKPPSLAEIEFVIGEVVQALEESREREELLAGYLRQQELLRRTMREAFMREMLSTRYRADELPRERIEFMGLPPRPAVQVLTLSLIRPDQLGRMREREWQLIRFGTGNILREMLRERLGEHGPVRAEVVDYSDREFVVVFLAERDGEAGELNAPLIREVSDVMAERVLQYMKVSLLGGLGSARVGYEQVIDSFLESQAAVETAEMSGLNKVFRYGEDGADATAAELPQMLLRRLLDDIFRRNLPEAGEWWSRLKEAIAGSPAALPVLKGVCGGVLSALWSAWPSTAAAPDAARDAAAASVPSASDNRAFRLDELLLALNRCGSAAELAEWMDEQVTRMLAQIREEVQGRKSHILVDRVIHEFIEKEYHRDLSLEEIASALHVNRNYLSQLFKKITGEPFVTYLNKYRVEKAKELLMTGRYMVYEISEMVGFQNPTYFSQVFKSLTGCSPSAYNR